MEVIARVIALGQYIVNGIVEFLASTRLGQFSIKKIDAIFWRLEQVGKYSVQEDTKAENQKCIKHANMERPLFWPIFWIVLIGLHMFRVVSSLTLVKFNKKPIGSKDIVKNVQKWRRYLRSIRFSGLQKIRQQEAMKAENSEVNLPYTRHSKKKRYDDETADDLLNELMNRSFSGTDDMDPYVVGSSEDAYSSSSSDEEEFESSTKFDNKSKFQQSTEDTVPIEADIPETDRIADSIPNVPIESDIPVSDIPEADQPNSDIPDSDIPNSNVPEITVCSTDPNISTRSDDVTFESTICNLSADETAESLDFDETTETTNSNSHISEICENGKAILNQYRDPTDSLIAQLVVFNKENHSQL